MRAQVGNFCGALQGREELLITAEDALASVAVIEAAYASHGRFGVGSRERRGIGSVTPRIDPTAEIEPGVEIGSGTSIWDHVHVRGPARIGSDCIVGEKTYIAYGVEIGDRVKINAFVYVCNGVVVEDGVMIGAGAIFTNDRYPRATTPDLRRCATRARARTPCRPWSGRAPRSAPVP